MAKYWLCVVNEENWRIVKEKLVWGVSDRYKRKMEQLEEGDMLAFYVRPKRLGGIFRAVSKPYVDKKPIFSSEGFREGEVFPNRVKIEPVLVPEEPVPFEPLIGQLGFIKKKDKWTGYLRGAMRQIPEEDFKVLEEALRGR